MAEGGVGPNAADDGTLAYGRTTHGLRQLTWFDRDGTMRGAIGQPQDSMHAPAISPDATRVAVAGLENGLTNIWIHEIGRAVKSRVTFGPRDVDPAWHPTDSRIAFQTTNWDVASVSADGGREPTLLLKDPIPEFMSVWSRDAKYLVYGQFSPKGQGDIWAIDAAGQRKAIVDGPFSAMAPTLSPDGRFVAFVSDETGTNEVFVRTFPDGQGQRQVSSGGGMWPKWRGTEIFFIEKSTLMSATVRTAPALQIDAPKVLFKLEDRAAAFPLYDTLDGQRFIIVRTIKPPQNGIAIVQHWLAEFKK